MGPLDWLFDLNGDGTADGFDLALGMMLLDEMEKEEKDDDFDLDDDLDDDLEDF